MSFYIGPTCTTLKVPAGAVISVLKWVCYWNCSHTCRWHKFCAAAVRCCDVILGACTHQWLCCLHCDLSDGWSRRSGWTEDCETGSTSQPTSKNHSLLVAQFVGGSRFSPHPRLLTLSESTSTQRRYWLRHWYCVGVNPPKRYRQLHVRLKDLPKVPRVDSNLRSCGRKICKICGRSRNLEFMMYDYDCGCASIWHDNQLLPGA